MVVIREDFVRVLRPLSCQTVLFLSTQSLAEEPASDSMPLRASSFDASSLFWRSFLPSMQLRQKDEKVSV